MSHRLAIIGTIAVVVLAAALGIFGYLRLQEQPRFAYPPHPLSDVRRS